MAAEILHGNPGNGLVDRADAPDSLAADTQAAHRVGAANGYRNRRRGRAKWLGKTTDEPVEEIGELVTQ